MVLDSIQNHRKYLVLHPLFQKAFDFIESTDLSKLTIGKHTIEEEDLFAIISKNEDSEASSKLESHQKYIDIHVAVTGNDTIGWKAREDCLQPEGAFHIGDDYILYADTDYVKIKLAESKFMILYPEDAHAPLLQTKDLFKIVLKVKL